jgi:hypothetical protein
MIKLSRLGLGIILGLTTAAAILAPGADLPANGQEHAPVVVMPPPNQSPDSQRFDPVTPGQKIKQDKERVERYRSVPPPGEPPKTREVKPPETESRPSTAGERP